MITVRSIDCMAIRGTTEDGFRIRIDVVPDTHGRFRYLVEGHGMSDASSACTRQSALDAAEMSVAMRRRRLRAAA